MFSTNSPVFISYLKPLLCHPGEGAIFHSIADLPPHLFSTALGVFSPLYINVDAVFSVRFLY